MTMTQYYSTFPVVKGVGAKVGARTTTAPFNPYAKG